MRSTYKSITIICEGKSELVYIQAISSIFIKIGYIFQPKLANGSNNLVRIYNKIRKDNRNSRIEILCDEDVFFRGVKKCKTLERALTNYLNFEDFCVLHLQKDLVLEWQEICEEHRHFDSPMTAELYEKSIQSIFPGYKKGILPFENEIDVDMLQQLFENNDDISIKIKSKFASFLKELMREANIHTTR